tara:strand:- start:2263 stop:2454 length:192 start_codon:yes stop_codon:yes gene_type:complete
MIGKEKDFKMYWIFDRAREPSTWAGLAGLAIALGLTADQWAVYSGALAGIAAVVAMVLRERST